MKSLTANAIVGFKTKFRTKVFSKLFFHHLTNFLIEKFVYKLILEYYGSKSEARFPCVVNKTFVTKVRYITQNNKALVKNVLEPIKNRI